MQQSNQQKHVVPKDFPFDLFVTNINGFPPHWHEELELVYVMNGTSEMSINDRHYHLQKGDILICHPGDVHHFHHQNKAGDRIIIQFAPVILGPLNGILTRQRFAKNFIAAEQARDTDSYFQVKNAIEMIAGICREFKNELVLTYRSLHNYYRKKFKIDLDSGIIDISLMPMVYLEDSARKLLKDKPLWKNEDRMSYRLAIMSQLFSLVAGLRDHLTMEELSSGARNRQRQVLDRLRAVFSWVENNYKKPIVLEDAADVANFSMYHFSRFFKQATGLSFARYLNNYRISIAVNHLLSSSETISEIAFSSGFSSLKTFNRVFRELKGTSPREFRKTAKFD
jgi:AraC-like DNA-binding protein